MMAYEIKCPTCEKELKDISPGFDLDCKDDVNKGFVACVIMGKCMNDHEITATYYPSIKRLNVENTLGAEYSETH